MNTQPSKMSRQLRLSRQTRRLYAVDQDGRRMLDSDGKQFFDLDRAPLVLADLGVPPTLSRATLTGSKFKLVEEVREWYGDLLDGAGDEYCAILIGSGSNYTAAALLSNAVRRGLTVAWYDWHTFTSRYTKRITHDRVLTRGTQEEASAAAEQLSAAETEEDDLREVYDVLAIVDFDINDVRDFAVPEICAMIRHRTAFALTTVVTVPTANSDAMDADAKHFGGRGSLIRLFEHEARDFDGRQ